MATHSPLVTGKDVVLLLGLPILGVTAATLPERHWDRCCRGLARVLVRVRRERSAHLRQQIARVCRTQPLDRSIDDVILGLSVHQYLAWLDLLRYRTRQTLPRVSLIGREHVEYSQATGRGVILWVAPFMHSDLLTKAAVHRGGFAVSHLSRPEHGFSRSRFGRRWLNPIWTSAERQLLRERLVFAPGRDAVLRTLVHRLRRNEIISIAFGPQGSRAHDVPFLDGDITVAAGAIELSRLTGASLLPVFTVRDGAGGTRSVVEPALDTSEKSGTGWDSADLARQYAQRLASYVLRWPDQYQHWAQQTRRA